MRRIIAEHIVEFLGFSNRRDPAAGAFRQFSQKDWKRALRWTDDAGLALYFLQKLQSPASRDSLPKWVLSDLERKHSSNRERTALIARQFGMVNRRFDDAGIRYVVLKGFSLVPDFCANASLRHQSDLDYLVGETSLLSAQRILTEMGYRRKPVIGDQEFVFISPGNATRGPNQYLADTPHAVELHLDVWDSEQNNLPLMAPLFSLERTKAQRWNDLSFPALTVEDAFVLQVLHACQHLFTYWIRMSNLFEIGFFLNQRASDSRLWERLGERVGHNLMLREFTVVITEMVSDLFGVPLPALVRTWSREIRPATRIWIENYARKCAFCHIPAHQFRLFPQSKLILLWQRQYEEAQKRATRQRLVRFSRFTRMVSSVRDKPSMLINRRWWKHHLVIRRALFHVLADLRYICELPRWKWLNRTKTSVLKSDRHSMANAGASAKRPAV